jgi:metal-responsive CopG/Arc/MetJ family transcriptional regulator
MSRAPITLTIPEPLVEQLDTIAEKEYRSRSSLASQLLAEGLERRNATSKQEAEAEVGA